MRSWRDAASRTLRKPASGSSSGTTGQTLYFRPHCGGKNCKKRVMRPEIPRLERTFINLQLFPHNSLLPARRRISFQKGKKWRLGRSTQGGPRTQIQQEMGGKWSFRIVSGQKLWWGESKASYSGRLFFIFAINQNCSHSNSEFLNLSG